jgi:hypothetical protein
VGSDVRELVACPHAGRDKVGSSDKLINPTSEKKKILFNILKKNE